MSATRIHPLSGEPINGKPVNGKPRESLIAAFSTARSNRRANLSFDAARPGSDLDAHFAFADSLDPDSSYSKPVRHTLIKRSRYEQGSNGIYDGIINTHVNMLCGTGPQLRMLTKNRDFNQMVEREFHEWAQAVQLRRKLWAMAHARTGDGETFALLIDNPGINNRVHLDILPIEAEQCQTPFGVVANSGRVDGIYYDEFNNIIGYDILPEHPGGGNFFTLTEPVKVSAANVIHWFKLKRPGAHRGIPDMTSSMAVGATSRRHREATVAAAETAADIAALIYSKLNPAGGEERYPLTPLTEMQMPKRAILNLPEGWEAQQMRGEHPNAEYSDFHRLQVSETASPIGQPYNVAAKDSSTYSFASGKLDTLGYYQSLNIEREDCNDLVLDRIFAAWFREWTIVSDRRDIPPAHQWDWPAHPVIDAVAEASATDTKLKNGTVTLRQVFSDQGQDFEDQLTVMAEDWFGEASEENVTKARQICLLKNTPAHAMQATAALMGLDMEQQQSQPQEQLQR